MIAVRPPYGFWAGAVRVATWAAVLATAWASLHAIKVILDPDPAKPIPVGWAFLGAWHYHYAIFLTMLIAVAIGHHRLPAAARHWRLAGVVAIATLCAGAMQAALLRLHGIGASWGWSMLPYLLVPHAILSSLFVAVHEFGDRQRRSREDLHAAGMRRLELDRELVQARLALLQAQTEPHFLFNSLANVRRLLRTDRAAAGALLDALMRYFQEALPQLRTQRSTLAREAELVRAFLAVHQVRMGPRLQVAMDLPPALAGREVPTMVLLTLAENAIKHGLAPLAEGGRIELRARSGGGRLTLTVADTGRGMGDGLGHGTGLANLRSRLKAMYGDAASLTLRLNEPRGVVAEVALPDAADATSGEAPDGGPRGDPGQHAGGGAGGGAA